MSEGRKRGRLRGKEEEEESDKHSLLTKVLITRDENDKTCAIQVQISQYTINLLYFIWRVTVNINGIFIGDLCII